MLGIYKKISILFFLLFLIFNCISISANAMSVEESNIISLEDFDKVVQPFGSKLIAVKINGKWGYMNTQGKLVIPATFQEAHNFSEGLASVKSNEKWGYIDTTGKFVIKAEYEGVAVTFNNNYTQVERKGKWGVINKKGNIIIPIKYSKINPVNEGLASVKLGNKYGFINLKGKLVISTKYEDAYNFHNGLAPVKSKGKWGYINKSGKLVISYKYIAAESFNNGYARVVIKKGGNYLYGVIDKAGKQIIIPKFYQILSLNNGIAPYLLQNSSGEISMGYISLKTGKNLFKVKKSIQVFSEGYGFASYKENLLNVIYDRNGKKIYLKNKYYDISPLKNGYAIGTLDFEEANFRIIHKVK
ncbi:WG repeat-containing protein [Rummeliibacillus sp. TYF005]|uniref:WG repeat-containing protein n=1 Tax=Rummeliibacillus sp. TYF005 TaxID=2058214 RepID=UPI000F52F9F2|nr:WG repeat-containing protein [Rummeliibacillus sp. TYF005]RPJ95592.1 WG repeat-containing protein [Rummeliibacillus sp. TYF005]